MGVLRSEKCIQILFLPCASSVALGKLLNFIEPQFLHKRQFSMPISRLLGGLKDKIPVCKTSSTMPGL